MDHPFLISDEPQATYEWVIRFWLCGSRVHQQQLKPSYFEECDSFDQWLCILANGVPCEMPAGMRLMMVMVIMMVWPAWERQATSSVINSWWWWLYKRSGGRWRRPPWLFCKGSNLSSQMSSEQHMLLYLCYKLHIILGPWVGFFNIPIYNGWPYWYSTHAYIHIHIYIHIYTYIYTHMDIFTGFCHHSGIKMHDPIPSSFWMLSHDVSHSPAGSGKECHGLTGQQTSYPAW